MKDLFLKHIVSITVISLTINLVLIGFFGLTFLRNRSVPSTTFDSILDQDSFAANKDISKTALLNTLIDRFGYTSYLEIGQGKPENNFSRIKCRIRIGVDPDPLCNASYCLTSDEFFRQNNSTFDLIFVDGLHHAVQVYRDIINSLSCLNTNGTIVVHDCDPTDEAMQVVPQSEDIWTGDVWKAWVKLRSERGDLMMFVVDKSSGCGIIRAGTQKSINIPDSLTYKYLSENRVCLLNMKSVNDFLLYLKNSGK